MKIRRMTESDLREVGALYTAAWKKGYKGMLPQDFLDGIEPERWSGRIDFLDEGSFVIIDGEQIAAHVHARPAAEEKNTA